MSDTSMNRKDFLANVGKCCVGACACAMASGFGGLYAQETKPEQAVEPAKTPRSEERMKFAEAWVKRFFDVLDSNLDEATLRKIMMANGKACYINWITETKQDIKPVSFEKFKAWVEKREGDSSYKIDGNVIYFQYMSAAETGLPSDEGACLCTLAESKPAGLSGTFCICSVGYVKEMHERIFGRPVEVELVDAVLKGGKRCKFKITLV